MGRILLLALPALVLPAWTQPSGSIHLFADGVEIAQKWADEVADPDADRNMMIARYYVSRRDYTGAINRFKIVVTKFQTSRHVEEALAGLVQAYSAIGIPREAQNAAAMLIRKFPNSRWAAEAQDILDSTYPEPVEGEQP